MEDKLQEILNDSLREIERYKSDRDKLISNIEFCDKHKFDEESRIARIKFDSINMIIYEWSDMHKKIQELLNKWNS